MRCRAFRLHLPSTFRLIARLRAGSGRKKESEQKKKRERESKGDRMDD